MFDVTILGKRKRRHLELKTRNFILRLQANQSQINFIAIARGRGHGGVRSRAFWCGVAIGLELIFHNLWQVLLSLLITFDNLREVSIQVFHISSIPSAHLPPRLVFPCSDPDPARPLFALLSLPPPKHDRPASHLPVAIDRPLEYFSNPSTCDTARA